MYLAGSIDCGAQSEPFSETTIDPAEEAILTQLLGPRPAPHTYTCGRRAGHTGSHIADRPGEDMMVWDDEIEMHVRIGWEGHRCARGNIYST